MSNLEKYIKKLKKYKKDNPNLTELDLVRFVYIDLGKRFSFDLDFAFGNSQTKRKIYQLTNKNKEDMEERMDKNIVTCKSLSYIIEYVLKKFDIEAETVQNENDKKSLPHIYNKITLKDGRRFCIDLQQDLENIQFHAATKNFGFLDNGKKVFDRFYLEQIDRKIGYIDDENYYSDDYIYTIKSDIELFEDFNKKVEFVLENIQIQENKNMKYAERKHAHENILKEIFSTKEMRKIHFIDCYQKDDKNKEYKNCISVDNGKKSDIYMFSKEDNAYEKISIEEFAKQVINGLVCMQGITGLGKTIKKIKNEGR